MDPEFKAMVATLSPTDQAAAMASYEAAQRAEARAEERLALKRKAESRAGLTDIQTTLKAAGGGGPISSSLLTASSTATSATGVTFVSKKKRLAMKEEAEKKAAEEAKKPSTTTTTTAARANNSGGNNNNSSSSSSSNNNNNNNNNNAMMLTVNNDQLRQIRHQYAGKTEGELQQEEMARQQKKLVNKRTIFKFKWSESEDTSRDADPLYDIMSNKANIRREVDPLILDAMRQQNPAQIQKRKEQQLSVYEKPLTSMGVRDWRIIREDFDIRVRGGRVPNPLRRFNESSPMLHPSILYSITNVMGYTDPSPIQRQAIPIGLQRRDMIGIAETGSGKTCSFGIPLVHHVLSLNDSVLNSVGDEGPLAIVMAPTRELALQIDEEICKLLSETVLETLAIIGGTDVEQQAYKLRKGVHIIVGTPGRMQDVLESSYLVLNQCTYIVLDEADRMLDMGFEPQITSILEAMGGQMKAEDEAAAYEQEARDLEGVAKGEVPKHRLTAMFSATMPPDVERLARTFLRHPAIIQVGDQDSGKNKRIEQRVVYIKDSRKDSQLNSLLSQHNKPEDKIIVFVNEKKTADKLGKTLERSGKRCVVLHGGKQQDQREASLEQFKGGGCVLIATDVAGRGIDIPDVSYVINYDLPQKSIDPYCHRIGRTGRAGKSGVAYSFVTDGDTEIAPKLLQYLKQTNAFIPDDWARKVGKAGRDMENIE